MKNNIYIIFIFIISITTNFFFHVDASSGGEAIT